MKKRYIITIAVALSIIGLWLTFFMVPEHNRKTELNNSLLKTESRLADYQNIIETFSRQFEIHTELLKKKEYLLSRLYTKEDIIKLFGDLAVKSSNYYVAIVEFSPSVEELIALNKQLAEDNQPLHLDLIIKMRGQSPNIGRYIKDIESQNYYKGFNYCKIINHAVNEPNSEMNYSFKAILGTLGEGR